MICWNFHWLFWVEWDIAWWDFIGKSLDFMEKSWDFHGISWDIMGDSGISSCSILNGSDLGEKIMWSPVSPSTLGNPRSNCRGILQPWSIAKGYLIDFPWFSYVSWCFLMFLDVSWCFLMFLDVSWWPIYIMRNDFWHFSKMVILRTKLWNYPGKLT